MMDDSGKTQHCHIIVSNMNEAVWIKPNAKVDRFYAIGLLTHAINMILESDGQWIHPEDCPLPAFLTVDDSQQFEEEEYP